MASQRGWKHVIEGLDTEIVAWIGNDVVIARTSETVTSGSSGTLVGHAGKGSILIDDKNGLLYINTNTKDSPTWTLVGTQTAS